MRGKVLRAGSERLIANDACWPYPSEAIGDHQQNEKSNREPDAKSQGFHCPVAFAFIAHKKKQCRTEAGKNEDKRKGDNDLHVEHSFSNKYLAYVRSSIDALTNRLCNANQISIQPCTIYCSRHRGGDRRFVGPMAVAARGGGGGGGGGGGRARGGGAGGAGGPGGRAGGAGPARGRGGGGGARRRAGV